MYENINANKFFAVGFGFREVFLVSDKNWQSIGGVKLFAFIRLFEFVPCCMKSARTTENILNERDFRAAIQTEQPFFFKTVRSRLFRLKQLEEILNNPEKLHTYSKKMQSSLTREHRKMFRNLNGIREMNRFPEAMVIIDPKKEHNAVKEAKKLGIVTVALIDTDSDPDEIDLPIPCNDDSIRSIEVILRCLADAVVEGRKDAGIHMEMSER